MEPKRASTFRKPYVQSHSEREGSRHFLGRVARKYAVALDAVQRSQRLVVANSPFRQPPKGPNSYLAESPDFGNLWVYFG